MNPFLKISKKVVNLTDTAAYLYYVLVYADFKKKTYSRAYLAKAIGLNNLDYVTELLREIENWGLIKRDFVYGNEYVNGHISKELRVTVLYDECVDCDVNWFPVSLNVLGLDVAARDKGFALKLRAIAFDDTMQVKYNRKDIAAIMEVSQPTLRKKMKAIEVMYKDGFVAEYFPVCEKCYLSKENVEVIKEVLMYNDQTSRIYKQIKWFLQNKFHLRRDADDRLRDVFAGLLGQKKVVRKVERAVFDW